jgi:hypothetical protein
LLFVPSVPEDPTFLEDYWSNSTKIVRVIQSVESSDRWYNYLSVSWRGEGSRWLPHQWALRKDCIIWDELSCTVGSKAIETCMGFGHKLRVSYKRNTADHLVICPTIQ